LFFQVCHKPVARGRSAGAKAHLLHVRSLRIPPPDCAAFVKEDRESAAVFVKLARAPRK